MASDGSEATSALRSARGRDAVSSKADKAMQKMTPMGAWISSAVLKSATAMKNAAISASESSVEAPKEGRRG